MAFVQSAMNTALAPTSIAFNNQRVMSSSAMVCANKNALLSCETEELTAIKINPEQSTLPGSPQVVASTCRLFLIRAGGGCRGMGCRSGRAYVP